MTVYLDTNIVIYVVEQSLGLGSAALAAVHRYYREGHAVAVSDLVRMECMVGPLMNGDGDALRAYRALFGCEAVSVLSCPSRVFDRAAVIRADHGLRPVDALHLATAIEGGCERFLTNDVRLTCVSDIEIELLEP